MPQIETTVSYLHEVFCSGYPMFAMASSPNNMDEAMMYNTIIGENSIRGGWVRHLDMFFRDCAKYNIGGLEVDWCTEKIYSLVTDQNSPTTEAQKKDILWKGNKLKRMDMYNTIFDPRVPIAEIHTRGEFAGYVDMFPRIQLKQFIANLPAGMVTGDTANEAFETGVPVITNSQIGSFYIPEINPDPIVKFDNLPDSFNWFNWAENKPQDGRRVINYKNCYQVSTLYVRIIPSDFGMNVPERNQPQIWKLIIVNDQVLLYAQRMTNAHGYLPIVFSQMNEDGLRFNTKSDLDNIAPYQDIATALWLERLATARRRVSDRALYNPNLIRPSDINNPEPTAKIPVRNSAYGRQLSEAFYQIPFQDQNAGNWTQEASAVVEMSQLLLGKIESNKVNSRRVIRPFMSSTKLWTKQMHAM